jgi:hypothetical protein
MDDWAIADPTFLACATHAFPFVDLLACAQARKADT